VFFYSGKWIHLLFFILLLNLLASTTNNNNHTTATTTTTSNSVQGNVQQSTISSIPLNSPSPRYNDGGLQTHSPVAIFSTPNSSPITPMGTDTDFGIYPSPNLSGAPVAGGQDTSSKQSTPQAQQQPPTPTGTQFPHSVQSTSQRSSLEPHQSPLSRQSRSGPFIVNDEALKILQKNTKRLTELESSIRQLVSYGCASDEFLLWLQDERAYNIENEPSLMKCAQVSILNI
jgi:hypothetical protein